MTHRKLKTNGKATSISAEVEINTSKHLVWEILNDIGDIQKFHPLIKKSYSTTDLKNGIGAKRSCELLPIGQMVEEVVEWNEGTSITMEVIGGKMLPPYLFMRGHIKLSGMGDQTKVRFTLSYMLKYGVVGRIMNVLLIKPQFKKAPPKYVEGLKNYVEGLSH